MRSRLRSQAIWLVFFRHTISFPDMKLRLSIIVAVCLITIQAHAADEVVRLHALFDRTWETQLKESPLFATSVGRHEYDDRLPSVTMADLERRHAQTKATLAELAGIDRSKLPVAEVVNYDIFKQRLEDLAESFELGDYQGSFNAHSGVHSRLSRF